MAFDGFALGLVVWFAIFIVLYGATFGYQLPDNGAVRAANNFRFFSNINVMAFVGFGALMSFNARLGMTATATSLVLGSVAALWYMLNRGLWEQAIGRVRPLETVRFGQDFLVRADFAVSSMLIGFGALIGRVTPLQGLIFVIIHIGFYSVNESIGEQRFRSNDPGGSMTIHLFGALAGVMASLVLEGAASRRDTPTESCTTPTSIVRSLLGTLFLFVNWPSFNCYFSAQANPLTLNSFQTPVCVANTYLALASGGMMAFMLSRFFSGNRMMVEDVQNSVLAGAIAIGATSNVFVTTFGAVIIGAVAALISVVGIRYVNPFLARTVGLRDTCNVLSLHGLPGFFGGVVAIIVAGSSVIVFFPLPYELYPGLAENRTQSSITALQVAYLALTMGMASVAGVFAGLLMRLAPSLSRFGTDTEQWAIPSSQDEAISE